MSLKLELIAVEFPIGYSKELIQEFIITYDRIVFKDKLHIKNADNQVLVQHKKYLGYPDTNVIKTEIEWGDQAGDNTCGIQPIVMKHKAKLHFTTENPKVQLIKHAQRGAKLTGAPTGRPKGKKANKCNQCQETCPHKMPIKVDISGLQEETN